MLDIPESALFQRLRNHGISAKLAAAWIKQDEARARAAVKYVEARRAEAEKAKREREMMDRAMAWFETLPETERQPIETAFLAEADAVDAGRFRTKGSVSLGFRFFVKRTWKATQYAA